MKMKSKKIVAMVMATVLGVGLLAGCGKSEKGGTQTSGNAQTKNSDVVTLKWVMVGNGMPENYDAWQKQINPYLEEKIGINLETEIVPWGDWDNRRSVIVNSGENFDILFTDQNRYNSEVDTGAFLDISQLLKDKGSNLYEMIPEDYWKAVSIDGKIYGVPTYKDSSVTEYFVWDKAVADKYQVDISTIRDYEALYPALKTIKEGEGTAPFYMSKSGADFLSTAYFDSLGTGLAALGVKYDDDTKTVVNPLEDEDILKTMDVIHKMYQEGIINGDAPTSDDSNKYRTFFTAQGWSKAAKTTWGPNNSIDDCEAIQFGDPVVSNTTVRGSINAISAGSKNPEKAMEFLQLVNTDTKVRDWLYYGVEGENFKYTADQKVDKLNSDWSMAGYTQGTFFNVSQLETDTENQWDEVKELNKQAKPSVMLGFDMDTSKVKTELANCHAVYEKYKQEFWTGAQEPRELVTKLKGELEAAGWDTIRQEAQDQINNIK